MSSWARRPRSSSDRLNSAAPYALRVRAAEGPQCPGPAGQGVPPGDEGDDGEGPDSRGAHEEPRGGEGPSRRGRPRDHDGDVHQGVPFPRPDPPVLSRATRGDDRRRGPKEEPRGCGLGPEEGPRARTRVRAEYPGRPWSHCRRGNPPGGLRALLVRDSSDFAEPRRLGGGAAPAEEVPGHRPGGSDDRRRGLSERREERVRRAGEYREPSGRSIPLHNAGRFRGTLRRWVHAVPDPGHAGPPGPPDGREEPDGETGHHRPRPRRGLRCVPCGSLRDVRARALRPDAAPRHRPGTVPRGANPRRREQVRLGDTGTWAPRDVDPDRVGRGEGPRG